jgi:hypothetical protein
MQIGIHDLFLDLQMDPGLRRGDGIFGLALAVRLLKHV